MEGPMTPRGLSTSASFRESDVEFLQTQAREWLEAVLEEKLDPETSLQDLLADGSILYKISQIIKEDLNRLSGHVEAPHSPKVMASPDAHRKSSLKYQPYPYVEAFLKVCKEVGLLDLDLFNPSDAVDKKDIRHVCVCLRRLSKKARTRNIPVPDFDNVKHTMTTPSRKHSMPTEVVHSLRDSLQKSANKSRETSSSIPDLRKDNPELDGVSLEPGHESETFRNIHQKSDEAAEKREPVDSESNHSVKVAEPGVETIPSVVPETEGKKKEDTPAAVDTPQRGSVTMTSLARDQVARIDLAPSISRASSTDSKPAKHTGENTMGKSQRGETVKKPEASERNGALGKPHKGGFSWLPVVAAGVVVVVGTILAMVVVRERRPSSDLYEVRPGDTLSEISRRSGKASWRDLVHSNPDIHNPDLIFPSERLKL